MSNNKVKHCMCSQHRLNLTIPVLMAFFGTLTREVVHLSDVLTLRQKNKQTNNNNNKDLSTMPPQ